MKTTKELLLFAHLPEKYLHKIEVTKSNAPSASWARLSTQGMLTPARFLIILSH